MKSNAGPVIAIGLFLLAFCFIPLWSLQIEPTSDYRFRLTCGGDVVFTVPLHQKLERSGNHWFVTDRNIVVSNAYVQPAGQSCTEELIDMLPQTKTSKVVMLTDYGTPNVLRKFDRAEDGVIYAVDENVDVMAYNLLMHVNSWSDDKERALYLVSQRSDIDWIKREFTGMAVEFIVPFYTKEGGAVNELDSTLLRELTDAATEQQTVRPVRMNEEPT